MQSTASHHFGGSPHSLLLKSRATSVPSVTEAQLQELQQYVQNRPRSFSICPPRRRLQSLPSSREAFTSPLVNGHRDHRGSVSDESDQLYHSPSSLNAIPEELLSLYPSERQPRGHAPRSPLSVQSQEDQTRTSSRRSSSQRLTSIHENMSTFGYAFSPSMEPFTESPKYHAALHSSFPEYNTIQVPQVHVDGHPTHLGQPDVLFHNGEFATSPTLAYPKSPDPEMVRQRRQSYNERRLSKGRMRGHRSGSNAYLPNHSGVQDDGSGLPIAPAPAVSSGADHRHSIYAGSYTHPQPSPSHMYSDAHQRHGPPYSVGSLDLPLSVSADGSHSVYQPSPLPSNSESMDSGRPMDRYPTSIHRSSSNAGHEEHVRVVASRPKPQCWEHGCNGRQFSTFSNLLRHQRERAGTAAKSYCPNCGAEFTRTTARNGHMAHEKCKPRRNS